MTDKLNLTRLRAGLSVKLWAMWVLLAAVLVPMAVPSAWGLFLALLVPLLVDFVGRCLCWTAGSGYWMMRVSVVAQLLGITCLVGSFLMNPSGVFAGAVLACICQLVSARSFVAHLLAIAHSLDRPDLVSKLAELRSSLFRTGYTFYGVGILSVLVFGAAIFFGLMMYVIGIFITLPLAFILLLPFWMTCMFFHFLMLYSYQGTLVRFRSALKAQYETVDHR
ncbi:MAG: hypothetical protein KDB22_24260 [Planctomycetales bacterium]|nr:hypothetical protein [Planctomycetales bacterium]